QIKNIMKIIATLTGKKELKNAALLFSYFHKVKETGSSENTDKILGKPETTFQKWIDARKAESV
ncbi:hypothetical protein ACFLU5_04215, partial [Bacteroidota bacterium]